MCSQSVQSLQTSDNEKYRTHQLLKKIMTELENSRYLSESFIASINVVISDNEQDDVIISTQKKKWDSNYNKKHANSFTFL